MLTLLKSLTDNYSPRVYVYADSDQGSIKKIKRLEEEPKGKYKVNEVCHLIL